VQIERFALFFFAPEKIMAARRSPERNDCGEQIALVPAGNAWYNGVKSGM